VKVSLKHRAQVTDARNAKGADACTAPTSCTSGKIKSAQCTEIVHMEAEDLGFRDFREIWKREGDSNNRRLNMADDDCSRKTGTVGFHPNPKKQPEELRRLGTWPFVFQCS
jgi:hypothetical protein